MFMALQCRHFTDFFCSVMHCVIFGLNLFRDFFFLQIILLHLSFNSCAYVCVYDELKQNYLFRRFLLNLNGSFNPLNLQYFPNLISDILY